MNIKTLLTAVALGTSLLVGTAAFASYEIETDNETLYTDNFPSETAAYQAGFAIIDQLNEASQSELRRELRAYGADIREVEVNNATVSVEEFATAPGNILYRAVVDVNYSFEERQTDD